MKIFFLFIVISISNFLYSCNCNDIQNTIEILSIQKHYELNNFRKYWKREMTTEQEKFWYILGQCDGLSLAHEEVLRIMKWNDQHH